MLRRVIGEDIELVTRSGPDPNWVMADPGKSRRDVVKAMKKYAESQASLRSVARHMLGLYHGHRRARLWRRMLSDSARLSQNDPNLLLEAMEAVESLKFPEPETAHERRPQAEQV